MGLLIKSESSKIVRHYENCLFLGLKLLKTAKFGLFRLIGFDKHINLSAFLQNEDCNKMNYSGSLDYIIGNSCIHGSYSSSLNYFSKCIKGYSFRNEGALYESPAYKVRVGHHLYQNHRGYFSSYTSHSFLPQAFLSPSRPRARFVDDNKIKAIAGEAFELMMAAKLPEDISINILPFEEFKALHSRFGAWSSGILGFSINGNSKKIFVRENRLDELMIVLGHEIGHVLTRTLPNRHDEEAKAFSFSIEWAKTIKKHNVADLGSSIKDEISFNPARNGLHDIAFAFVDFMVKNGRKAMLLHDDFVKRYISVFDRVYF